MRTSLVQSKKEAAKWLLSTTVRPLNVGDIARELHTSWTTARQVVTELVAEGAAEATETTNGTLYRAKTNTATEILSR
jgi:Mn-dependent DtxR family transcriptional regulator